MPSCAWSCHNRKCAPRDEVHLIQADWITTPWRSRFMLLSRFAPRAGLVTLRQTFVYGSHWVSEPRVSSQRSHTGHLNRGIDGVFEIVRLEHVPPRLNQGDYSGA